WKAFNAQIQQMKNQGYSGLIEYTNEYDYWQTIPTEPAYNPPKSFAKFVYYLGGKNAGVKTWPGIRYPRLKAGCERTISDSSPDFCTRVDVHVNDQIIGFANKRTCQTTTDAAGAQST